MKRQYESTGRIFMLLLGAGLMLASTVAAVPQSDAVGARAGITKQVSVDVRITARRPGAARFQVIKSGATLHAGDEVRIEMTAEKLSYAYIFHRGSSGDWKLLFPNPDESGDPSAINPLLPDEVCAVPGEKSRLVLGGIPGTEELVVYVLPRPDQSVISDLAVRLHRGEQPHIQLDGLPPDAKLSVPSPQEARVVPPEEVKGSLRVAMRDLTFVPSQESGEVRLPTHYAIDFSFHNAGPPPAGRLP